MFDDAHGHRMNYRIMKLERYIERHGLEDSEKHTDRLEELYQMRSDLQRMYERQRGETVQLGKGRFGM